jgi:hypothetical protein
VSRHVWTLDFLKLRCKVDLETHCWEWPETTNPAGNPVVSYNGKHVLVRRLAYFLTHGKWPEKPLFPMFCRSKSCCNPNHMKPVDRSRIPGLMKSFGMIARGTKLSIVRRARPSRSTLDWEKARALRAKTLAPVPAGITTRQHMQALADEAGLNVRTVWKLKSNKIWVEGLLS